MLHISLFYENNANKHTSPAIGILAPAPLQLQFISHFSARWNYIPATSHMGTFKWVMTTCITYQRLTHKTIPQPQIRSKGCIYGLCRGGSWKWPRGVNPWGRGIERIVTECAHDAIFEQVSEPFTCGWARTFLLTFSMARRRSWDANRISASQEIPRILCNPMVYFHI
jgi:hypothetical protein